ncbi:carbohydrate kinase family protein [Candidatus Roizmanbacteria bacterium]|nr:carbohydrate kinase family protein [Candidatus Roizmanbacteria bacterium]
MLDLVSIGNISIDLYFRGDDLTYDRKRFQLAVGGKYFVDYLYEGIGGGGANVAVGATQNGLRCAVLGIVGNNPFKKIILEELEEAGVSTHLAQFHDDYLNISAILLTRRGERTIINYEPPREQIFTSNNDLRHLLIAKAVYLGNLPDVSLMMREELLTFARKNNVMTFLNLGIKDCRRTPDQIKRLIAPAEVLFMNTYEFAEMIKKPHDDIDFKKSVFPYHPEIQKKIVILTDGKHGSYGYVGDHVCYEPAVPVKRIVDTTGAGDGYTAGFIAEYLKSKDVRRSMGKGAKYAAKILGKIGAN